jgi:glycosyltransferase involved in cell wall biosynthesis
MTEAVRQHCRQHGITHERLLVIYDALDPADFVPRRSREDVRGELGIPAHAPVAGVVGNIQEWKGQLVFVDALSRVRERIPEVRGVIVGGVHRAGQRYYDRLLARVRELRLGDAIIVTGFRTDVPDVMHALDVVVHTSVRPEPFGRVILEGMLCGKPVVASAAGGVPELIEHGRTGLLVPPGDAAALADAIETLLGDTAVRTAMGEEARRATEDRFGLARHVAEFEQLYRALGEERQGSCAS